MKAHIKVSSLPNTLRCYAARFGFLIPARDAKVRKMPDNYSVILSLIDPRSPAPAELLPGVIFDRANPDEVSRFRSHIERAVTFTIPYEYEWRGSTGTLLPPERWNYWIVRYQDADLAHDLDLAFSICSEDIELGLDCMWFEGPNGGGYGIGFRRGGLSAFFDSFSAYERSQILVTPQLLNECAEKIMALRERRTSHPQIVQIADRFLRLRVLPRFDMFYCFAHFTILEALLTHDPTTEQDGLAHQVSAKMKLLARRFETPLDDSFFVQDPASKKDRTVTLWKLLYGFRSKIAHGDVPSFDRDYKFMKNMENAGEFVRQAAKRVIQVALREPDLIADLRNC